MEVVYSRCCGLDVHKRSISACIKIREQGRTEKHEERFGSYTQDLERLREWLARHGVTQVAMEATGVYWKPVWNVLEGHFGLLLVNPQQVKALSGKKTDRRDAEHLGDLLQYGLLQGSFVPPPAIRELRDLTRQRARTVQEVVRINNRIQKLLEDANIKLSSVASEVLGMSGRRMLEALSQGETEASELAGMALGRLRKKRVQLEQALAGRVTEHHRLMLRKYLRALRTREEEIAEDEADIRQRIAPFQQAVQAWRQLPGVDEITAWSLVAEMGPDLAVFPTAAQAASWACVCPGNHESGGKRGSGQTRKGNPWLRRTLCEAAWGAANTKKSYFHALHKRLCARRGPQRALMAVAHSLVIAGFYLVKHKLQFQDLGADFFDRQDRERTKRRLIKRFNALGYEVILRPQQADNAQPAMA
jgi:transposase